MYYSFDLILEINKIKKRFDDKSIIILTEIMDLFRHNEARKIFAAVLGEINKSIKFLDNLLYMSLGKDKSVINEYNNFLENTIRERMFGISALILFEMGYSLYDLYSLLYWEHIQKFVKDLWSAMPERKLVPGAKKGFEELFNDVHDHVIENYPEKFIIELKNIETMYRARKWDVTENYELMITPNKYAKNNRWNPDGVAFMYLACGNQQNKFSNTINLPQKTCFEELQLNSGCEVVICEFKAVKKNAKLINLYFEDEDMSEIVKDFYEISQNIYKNEIDYLFENEGFMLKMEQIFDSSKDKDSFYIKSKDEIFKRIRNDGTMDQLLHRTHERMGWLFLTLIDKTIFEPIDIENDPALTAYFPFRYFSDYLRKKGYDGIIYRSTRMNKIGLKGKNVVLFDNSYATYNTETMKKFRYEDDRYLELEFE